MNPRTPTFVELANDLLEVGRARDAVEVCSAGLQVFSDHFDGYVSLARALRHDGQLREAQAALLRALRLEPDHGAALKLLGQVLLARGEKDRAVKVIEHAARVCPADAEIQRLLDQAKGRAPEPEPWADDETTDAHAPAEDLLRSSVPPAADDDEPPTARAGTSGGPAERVLPSFADVEEPPTVDRRNPSRPPPGPAAAGGGPAAAGISRTEVVYEPAAGGLMPPPDLRIGAGAGPEDPEATLRALVAAGLLDPPERETAATPWEAGGRFASGTGRWFLIAWVVLALGVAGGWFGYRRYAAGRARAARDAIATARAALLAGDARALGRAEQAGRQASRLRPLSKEAAAIYGLASAMRLLVAGDGDDGTVRAAVHRASDLGATGETMSAARIAMPLAEGNVDEARAALGQAQKAGHTGALIVYLRGVEALRRSDAAAALPLLRAALAAEPSLNAARIDLALLLAAGDRAAARRELEEVLRRNASSGRAQLELALLESETDAVSPQALAERLGSLNAKSGDLGRWEHSGLHLLAARVNRRAGRTEPAAEAVHAAVRAGPGDPRIAARLAEEALRLGQLSDAQRAADAAVVAAPASPPYRALLCRVLLERRSPARAIAALEGLDLSEPEVRRLRARAALLARDFPSATTDLEALLRANGGDVSARALLLRVRAASGQPLPVAEARTLGARHPANLDAQLAAAEILIDARSADEAARVLDAAIQRDGGRTELHYLRGRARRMRGQIEGAGGAIESFREASRLNPDFFEADLAIAELLFDKGDFEDAAAAYGRIAQTTRGANFGRLGRAEALWALGRLDEAETLVVAATKTRDLPRGRLLRGRILLSRGQARRAVEELRPLAEVTDPTAEAVTVWATAQRQSGDARGAEASVEAALRLDGGYPEALILKGDLLMAQNRAPPALRVYQQALGALRDRLRPPRLRAGLLTSLGRAELAAGAVLKADALAHFRQAIDVDGRYAPAHYYLGAALGAVDPPAARAALERYLALDPRGNLASPARRALSRLSGG